jgi:hypothetical protein
MFPKGLFKGGMKKLDQQDASVSHRVIASGLCVCCDARVAVCPASVPTTHDGGEAGGWQLSKGG